MKKIAYVLAAVAVLVLAIGTSVKVAYHRGEDAGVANQQAAIAAARLAANAQRQKSIDSADASAKLRIAAADSLARIAQRKAATARAREDSARRRIDILSDSLVSIDSLPPAPADPALITAIRRADERRALDSTAKVSMQRQIDERDGRLRIKDMSIKNLLERDSVHVDTESRLRNDATKAEKRGFWKGVKTGGAVTLGILAAAAAILK